MAHDMLNKFYDGDPKGSYALNDTGKPLGDLLLNETKTEIGDTAYNALSAEEKRNTADLQQIILESTGSALLIVGQEWLALYVNRSAEKGNPILANSLTLLTGKDSENTLKNCNACLHMFGSTSPVKIDNDKFSFRADKDGMYLYWKGDAAAYTASAFNAGYLALAAIGGLAPGIVGTTAVMLPRLRKKKEEAAA